MTLGSNRIYCNWSLLFEILKNYQLFDIKMFFQNKILLWNDIDNNQYQDNQVKTSFFFKEKYE